MERITLQIQSIIYKNEILSLLKAIEGIDTALEYCKTKGLEIETQLYYGDASPNPILQDEELRQINGRFHNLSLIHIYFNENTGTAKGHNKLGKDCKADYMMIMNPDIILQSNCIFELLKMFKAEDVGMVEARQTPLELAKIYDLQSLETEWASTACTMFRTNIFHVLNGFDYETFFMYCDDLDFSWRLRLEGYRIIYNPNAVVYHAKTLTNNGSWKPTSAEIYYSAEAAILMAHKYSNFDRVDKLLKQFDNYGGADEKKAANEFRKRKREGRLPDSIDAEHKVSKFIGDNYSLMRFSYNK